MNFINYSFEVEFFNLMYLNNFCYLIPNRLKKYCNCFNLCILNPMFIENLKMIFGLKKYLDNQIHYYLNYSSSIVHKNTCQEQLQFEELLRTLNYYHQKFQHITNPINMLIMKCMLNYFSINLFKLQFNNLTSNIQVRYLQYLLRTTI